MKIQPIFLFVEARPENAFGFIPWEVQSTRHFAKHDKNGINITIKRNDITCPLKYS